MNRETLDLLSQARERERLISSRQTKFALLVLAGVVLLVFLVVLGCAYMEARTYNKLTGAHVTTWDAMWVDLRVQDKPQP
jgi:hypothetical protein